MTEKMPEFVHKSIRRKPKDNSGSLLGADEAADLLERLFLKTELVAINEELVESAQRTSELQIVADTLRATLDKSVQSKEWYARVAVAYRDDLIMAYAEFPQKLDQAWGRGYLAGVKAAALRNIEMRRMERENRMDRIAVNLIRGRVTTLITNIPQTVYSVVSKLRNII